MTRVLHDRYPCCLLATRDLREGRNTRRCPRCGVRYSVMVERSPLALVMAEPVLRATWHRWIKDPTHEDVERLRRLNRTIETATKERR